MYGQRCRVEVDLNQLIMEGRGWVEPLIYYYHQLSRQLRSIRFPLLTVIITCTVPRDILIISLNIISYHFIVFILTLLLQSKCFLFLFFLVVKFTVLLNTHMIFLNLSLKILLLMTVQHYRMMKGIFGPIFFFFFPSLIVNGRTFG